MKELRFGPGVCPSCGVNHGVRTCEEYKADHSIFRGDGSQLLTYRDIFSEITAKAVPFLTDGDRILSYVVPCGPIHRAAGKLGFQMFDGERHLAAAIARIAGLEAELKRKK